MIHTLLRTIVSPDTACRMHELAAGAPASAAVSLRLELPAIADDWLDSVPAGQNWWYRARPRHGEYRLGIGHALYVTSAGSNRFSALDAAFAGLARDWRRNGPALAFAGFAFADDNHAPLPNALLAIPAILLESIGDRRTLTLCAPAGRIREALAEWPQWLTRPAATGTTAFAPAGPEQLAEQAWKARVTAALRDIAAGRIDKVVLSRCRHIEGDSLFSPSSILGTLTAQQPDSVIYAHSNGKQTFLGATPERLVLKRGRQIHVDALAGTAWPGSPALADDKNRHEQSLVVRAVIEALAPLCDGAPQIGLPAEHPAGRLWHWRSAVQACSRASSSLFDFVRALHPTPAVGGFPGEAALHWLNAHKEQRHGWYSGGFGILSPEGDGDFSVALRSALIDGRHATLQAGAGIVAGSNPEQELAETEAKLGTLLAALEGVQPTCAQDSRSA